MSFEDEKYRNALTEVSPALSKILEPLNTIAMQFDTDYTSYLNLNYNEFVKTNPTTKKIAENFLSINDMS